MSYFVQRFPSLIWVTHFIAEKEDMRGNYHILLCLSYHGAGTPPHSISGVHVDYMIWLLFTFGVLISLEVDPSPMSPATFTC